MSFLFGGDAHLHHVVGKLTSSFMVTIAPHRLLACCTLPCSTSPARTFLVKRGILFWTAVNYVSFQNHELQRQQNVYKRICELSRRKPKIPWLCLQRMQRLSDKASNPIVVKIIVQQAEIPGFWANSNYNQNQKCYKPISGWFSFTVIVMSSPKKGLTAWPIPDCMTQRIPCIWYYFSFSLLVIT